MADTAKRSDDDSEYIYPEQLGFSLKSFCKSLLPMAAIILAGLTMVTAVALATV